MNDYLDFLEKYKDFKEISDIVDEVRKLRVYYHTQQYDKMQQHINKLTSKYLAETYAWNTTFSSMPATVEQAYKNAEDFLRVKGISVLLSKGIKLQGQLSAEEVSFIEFHIQADRVVKLRLLEDLCRENQ